LATLLRGGAVGRRVRVKAVLLSSSRSDFGKFASWVRFEMVKGIVPIVPVVVAGSIGRPLPAVLSNVLMATGAGWMIFVIAHACAMAFRMNRRHEAYMRAIGIDLSLGATLGNPKLWRRVGTKVTMREALAEIKASQAGG
jgi:hypothetical protein